MFLILTLSKNDPVAMWVPIVLLCGSGLYQQVHFTETDGTAEIYHYMTFTISYRKSNLMFGIYSLVASYFL
jgi:hypothetical protein